MPVDNEVGLFEAAHAAHLPVILKGPTGCGKTRFLEYMSWYLGAAGKAPLPLVTITCHEDLVAGDLVGREEYGLNPAETQPYKRQLQPDTKFIGVVAAFRDLEHSRWRQVVPVPAERQSTIAIGIEARAVTLTVGPEGGSFFSKVFPWLSKDAPSPSKDAALPSKDAVLPSKDAALPSKDVLLAQANGMATDLATMKSSGKLTPEQATQTGKLLVKATTLKSDLENLKSVDPLKLSQLMSTLVDLQQQIGALKALMK